MGIYTKVSQQTFEELQTDAGVLLKTFNPASPAEPSDANIITATTGGITVSCVPSYSDWGEDVDNAPSNTKELKHLDGWNCTMSTNALGVTADTVKLALGAADKDGTTKIVPRKDLEQTDFANLWWVGDLSDGGLAAVELKNALSTGGFVLKTTKNGKGQLTLELTGHVSLADQTDMPMDFYVIPAGSGVSYTYTEVANPGSANPKAQGWYVLYGDVYSLTTDTAVDSNKTYYSRSTT